jgi:hypothetical protein
MNRTKWLAMLMISAVFAAMVHGDERESGDAGSWLPPNVARGDSQRLRAPIVNETSYADLVALFDDTSDPAARRRR